MHRSARCTSGAVSAAVIVSIASALAASSASAQIVAGQVDDFNDMSVAGWVEGFLSPNPPVVIGSGGPDGSPYISNFSSGTAGPGSRQVMFNNAQWTGDYNAAGVDSISMMMRADAGGGSFDMRLYVEADINLFFVGFASAEAQTVIADGVWREYTFSLTADAMAPVFTNGETIEDILGAVRELRLVASSAGPSRVGDSILGTLDVDNITALPSPGTVLLPAAFALVAHRRRR